MAENKNVNFKIVRLKELEFQYFVPKSLKQNNEDKYLVSTSVAYRWEVEKKLFGIVIGFTFSIEIEENKLTDVLIFSNLTEFFVDDLNDIFAVKEDGEFNIDENWEITFVGLAVSSARGMMASRTAGTYYEKIIFPVINPKEILVSKVSEKRKSQ
jgi:hypothetical protein